MEELEELTILENGCVNVVGSEICKHLKELKQLTSLAIGGDNEVGSEGGKHLKELKQLTSLEIGGVNAVGSEGCEHLKELKELTSTDDKELNWEDNTVKRRSTTSTSLVVFLLCQVGGREVP